MTSERTKVRRSKWRSSIFVVAAVGVAAHAGCTPDFDALVGGASEGGAGAGGAKPGSGGKDSSGGTHAGAGASGNPGGGDSGNPGGGESSDHGGASAVAGQEGGGAGGSETLAGGAGGDQGATGGASGAGGTQMPPSTGGVGGGGAEECAERFADCNATTHDDGCETFLDSQQSCGNTCAGGDACSALTVCNAGECVAAQGLVELGIPFSATGEGQRFAERFTPMPDLTLKTLTVRMYVPGEATSGVMTIYPTDKDFRGGPAVAVLLATLNQGFTDVVVSMGEATSTFDPVAIYQLTIDIQSGAGPWEPVTKIYIDAVWSSDGVISEKFAANFGQTVPSSMLKVEGSTYQWLEALPAAD